MAASENTVKVLEYCKEHVGEMITQDTIAAALGLTAKQVNPMVTYWATARGGNVLQRSEPVEVASVDAEGKSVTKKVRYISYVGE
jgi:hypothetical protein